MELKMEFNSMFVLVGIVGIAFIIYKIIMKKIDKWDVWLRIEFGFLIVAPCWGSGEFWNSTKARNIQQLAKLSFIQEMVVWTGILNAAD